VTAEDPVYVGRTCWAEPDRVAAPVVTAELPVYTGLTCWTLQAIVAAPTLRVDEAVNTQMVEYGSSAYATYPYIVHIRHKVRLRQFRE
jgi:hypothetical protein